MNKNITGLAFKPILDGVIHAAGKPAGDIFLQLCKIEAKDIGSEHALFTVEQYYQAWSVADSVSGDALIGLHSGATFHPSDLGVMGYVLQNCKDIQQAMRLIIQTNPFGNNSVSNEVEFEGDHIVVSFNSPLNPRNIRHWVEMNVAAYLRMAHILTNHQYDGQFSYTEVHFAHARGGPEHEYFKVFQCPVKFDQPQTKFFTHLDHFSKPIYKSNANVLQAFSAQLGIRLDDDSFSSSINEYIDNCLPHTGMPEMSDLAKHFKMSTSTIKRKLAKESTSYSQLCQIIKERTVKEMLANEHIELAEIAKYLGYTSTSALSRAFKQWAGKTTKDYRENLE